MLSLAAFAAGLGWMAPVQAGNVVCKASVQDAHGIASGSPGAYTQTPVMRRSPADTSAKIAERSAHIVAP